MASRTNFQAHGLIKTRLQQQLYNKAHIANIYAGIADPKEDATVALMEVVLYKNIFFEDYFAVTSEQPASSTSKRHCDLVIKYLDSESEDIRSLCFGECKRSKTSQAFSLQALEEQALEYCMLYLEERQVPFVYAATMAGAHVRLWKCQQQSTGYALTPFWGQNYIGDWQEYKDIGNEEDAQLVEKCFTDMKMWPPTAHDGQTEDTYYQTALSYSAIDDSVESPDYPAEAPGSYAANRYDEPGSSSNQVQYDNQGDTSWEEQTSYTNQPFNEDDMMDDGQASYTNQAPNEYDVIDDGQASYTNPPSKQESVGRGRDRIVEVRVTRVPHMTSHDEFNFKDSKGHSKTTRRSDWVKTTYNGKEAWSYKGKRTTYVSYDRIFK